MQKIHRNFAFSVTPYPSALHILHHHMHPDKLYIRRVSTSDSTLRMGELSYISNTATSKVGPLHTKGYISEHVRIYNFIHYISAPKRRV